MIQRMFTTSQQQKVLVVKTELRDEECATPAGRLKRQASSSANAAGTQPWDELCMICPQIPGGHGHGAAEGSRIGIRTWWQTP
jgi:hypothetical protein